MSGLSYSSRNYVDQVETATNGQEAYIDDNHEIMFNHYDIRENINQAEQQDSKNKKDDSKIVFPDSSKIVFPHSSEIMFPEITRKWKPASPVASPFAHENTKEGYKEEN